ncbi:MAG: hypothetical protein RJA07_2592 [Bacteroidota bacterium]|jgi:uncharacterized protein YdhG (YjbR/CyaY superfamily)
MNKKTKNINEYISLQPDIAKEMLEQIREIVKSIIPDTEEIISYGMPAFKVYGRVLVYFAGFKNHCSLFPANASLIAEMKTELKNYKTSKGTIQFEFGKPLPINLIKKIVKIRMKENLKKSKL